MTGERRFQRLVKLAADRVGALVALVALSPFIAAIAIRIVVESGWPVVVRQARVGKDGREFRMLKFRTMVRDAVAVGQAMGLSDPFGVVPNDPRITRSGRFLRRTSLDELPQLWNVIRGEMSLVGPRPDLVEQVANYSEADRRRLAVLPGITGWAQIKGRDEIPWPKRIELDVWYIENWSLRLDLEIVFLTFAQLFRPEPEPVEDTMNIERLRARAEPREGALVEVDPDAWDELLARLGCADVYLHRDYVEGAAILDPGRPVFLHLSAGAGEVVFPCIVRDVQADAPRGGFTDVTTPYGYGGPVTVGAAAVAERFYELYDRWCKERGVVSTFVRFHPLLENHRYAGPPMRVDALGTTVAWRLDSDSDLLVAMHAHHRRLVRKARAAGLSVSVAAEPAAVDEFASLYEATMSRKAAASFYLFPDRYWQWLAGPLRDRVVRVDARRNGDLLASVLCLAAPPYLHYHLGATSDEGRALGASHLVLFEAACWARDRGLSAFHLGGGVGGRADSLFEFKRRFWPGGEREFFVGKAVHDPDAYRALAGTDELALDGFFPAYRRTGAGASAAPAAGPRARSV
jgi:serine/alanine adding enzyme